MRKSNILYLENGRQIDKSGLMNPFGANINDILAQSFFLENGFVGEFARKTLLNLLDWLDGKQIKNTVWNMEKAEAVVKSLGEPIIQTHLKHMIEHKKRIINEKNINNS